MSSEPGARVEPEDVADFVGVKCGLEVSFEWSFPPPESSLRPSSPLSQDTCYLLSLLHDCFCTASIGTSKAFGYWIWFHSSECILEHARARRWQPCDRLLIKSDKIWK